MMEVGAHFGHQTSKWNPKMKQFIYGARNGIHIINLDKTAAMVGRALSAIRESAASGKAVLFVGTKRQAQEIIREEAVRAKQPYVDQRWLGGTLTNFTTIQRSISKLEELNRMHETNDYGERPKKEILRIEKMREKLMRNLGGIMQLKGKPGIMIVVDPAREYIAVHEANRGGVPVVAIADTNCDPEGIDHLVPANDDALRAIRLFMGRFADACLEGAVMREERIRREEKGARREAASEGGREGTESVEVTVQKTHQKIYVAREEVVAEKKNLPTFELPETIRKKLEESEKEKK